MWYRTAIFLQRARMWFCGSDNKRGLELLRIHSYHNSQVPSSGRQNTTDAAQGSGAGWYWSGRLTESPFVTDACPHQRLSKHVPSMQQRILTCIFWSASVLQRTAEILTHIHDCCKCEAPYNLSSSFPLPGPFQA